MSKQGTEYELFVKQVYDCLNQADGLTDVQIQHDVKLVGAAGVKHQIDVYWTFKRGGVGYKVVVECKDYNRNVSIEKIRAFHSVLRDLGNVYGIVVSREGFQSGAIQYANKYGIQLMEIRQMKDSDWERRLRNIGFRITMRTVGEIRSELAINKKKAEEMGVTIPENNEICMQTDQTRIDYERMIVNKNIVEEKGSKTMNDLIQKLPMEKLGNDNHFLFQFEDALIHLDGHDLPVDGIGFTYDVIESSEQIDIRGDDVIIALVKNIIDGSEQTIDRFGHVKNRERNA